MKTTFVPHPNWWGPKEHNLTEVVYTPIQSDATRVAALLSGEVDMVYPVPQQDAARISGTGKHQLLTGFELRTIFVNMDQSRDELLESSVKGKNPFKDKRVRQAIYQAIDMEAIKSRIMGGTSHIAGIDGGAGRQRLRRQARCAPQVRSGRIQEAARPKPAIRAASRSAWTARTTAM